MTAQPVFTGPGNLEVQVIGIDGLPAEYRVRRHGIWVTYPQPGRRAGRNPRTVAELATLVDLGTLEEKHA